MDGIGTFLKAVMWFVILSSALRVRLQEFFNIGISMVVSYEGKMNEQRIFKWLWARIQTDRKPCCGGLTIKEGGMTRARNGWNKNNYFQKSRFWENKSRISCCDSTKSVMFDNSELFYGGLWPDWIFSKLCL